MSSAMLKKLLNIILKLGNELNQKDAAGFTFDSLLKLNSAKAFDKRTSILHYLVMVELVDMINSYLISRCVRISYVHCCQCYNIHRNSSARLCVCVCPC